MISFGKRFKNKKQAVRPALRTSQINFDQMKSSKA